MICLAHLLAVLRMLLDLVDPAPARDELFSERTGR